jgi:hypothetical protein
MHAYWLEMSRRCIEYFYFGGSSVEYRPLHGRAEQCSYYIFLWFMSLFEVMHAPFLMLAEPPVLSLLYHAILHKRRFLKGCFTPS